MMFKYLSHDKMQLGIKHENIQKYIDVQSYLQYNITQTVQPLFEYDKYKTQRFLKGKKMYEGSFQVNQINLHPMMYFQVKEGLGEIKNNLVLRYDYWKILSKESKEFIKLKDVYLFGYSMDQTIDGSPIQIVHKFYFDDYEIYNINQ